MAAVLLYFRHELWRIASALLLGLRRPRGARDARLPARRLHHHRHDPDRGLRADLQGPDRDRRAQPDADRLHADRARPAAAARPRRSRRTARALDSFTARDGIIVGFAQACALVPGVSRSGATLTGALFLGFNRADAARYSFLLSVPAVVLSGLFELRHVGDGDGARRLPTAIATLVAFAVGYCVDRVPAPLPRQPLDGALRRLSRRARRARARAGRGRRDQLNGRNAGISG